MRRILNIYSAGNSSNQFATAQNTRCDIIGELEAIIQYENHLHETENQSAKNTISDIVNEEKVHVGQLFGLLFSLDPSSRTYFEQGLKEFEEENKR